MKTSHKIFIGLLLVMAIIYAFTGIGFRGKAKESTLNSRAAETQRIANMVDN